MDTIPGVQQKGIILVRLEQLSSRLKHAPAKPEAWLHKASLLPKSLLKRQIWCWENICTLESGAEKFLPHSCQCSCNLSYWILSFICLWALIWFIVVKNLNHTVLPWGKWCNWQGEPCALFFVEMRGKVWFWKLKIQFYFIAVWCEWAEHFQSHSQCIKIASFLDYCWKTNRTLLCQALSASCLQENCLQWLLSTYFSGRNNFIKMKPKKHKKFRNK